MSFYLRLHASWIQRRARKSGGNFECRVGRRCGPKRNASTLPQRHARTLLLIFLRPSLSRFFSFPFFIHRPAFIFCACFIRTTTRETSCAIYVFRYRRGQMVPRHAAPSTVFTTLCLLTSFNRFACPRQFPFSFGGMKNNVGSYVVS